MADFTGHVDIGQKVHLDLDDAVPLAGLAPPSPHVKAEASRPVPPGFGLGGLCVKSADVVKEAGVSGRVGTRGAANWRLVDVYYFVYELDPFDAVVAAGLGPGPGHFLGQALVQHLVDQGALARAGNAGDADKLIQGEVDIQGLEVVFPGPPDGDNLAAAGSSFFRGGDKAGTADIQAGDGPRCLGDILQLALGHDFTAGGAGPRADVHNPIGGIHGVGVVLDDDQGVAQVP